MDHQLEVAERICSDCFGAPVRLDGATELQSSERTRVYRCQLVDGPATAPESVVVKQATRPYGTTFDGAIDGNVWNDWAGLIFCAGLPGQVPAVPRCFGGDRAAGLIVLEDLGEAHSLRDALAGADGEQAAVALVDFFTALGRLHASSAGRETLFHRLRRKLGFYDPAREFYQSQFPRLLHKYRSILQTLDLAAEPGAERELALAVAALQEPGPFHLYLHGDPSPANFLLHGSTGWLIDFEYGTYGPALLEACQARMLFPSSGFVARLPEPVIERMERAYRAELSRGCPAVMDREFFGVAFGAACAYWTINFAVWLSFSQLLLEDRAWGLSSMRERFIARADCFVRTTAEFDCYPALGESFRTIAAKLRVLWPEAADGPLFYPAFAG